MLETIRKAVTKIEVQGHSPSAIVMNPLDFESVELALSTTTAVQYQGLPFDSVARRLYGLPIVVANVETQGTAHVLASGAVGVDTDQLGILIEWTQTSNADDFAKNLVRARCETRTGTSVYQPMGVVLAGLDPVCSITGERLVEELKKVFAAVGGPPTVLRMDNGPELVSQALQQFCNGKTGMSYIPPGCPWVNGHIESFNNRLRKECLNRNHWNTLFEARVVIGDFKQEHNQRPSLSPGLPNAGRVRCGMQVYPHPGGLRDQLNPEQKNPTLDRGGLSNVDSPSHHASDLTSTVNVQLMSTCT